VNTWIAKTSSVDSLTVGGGGARGGCEDEPEQRARDAEASASPTTSRATWRRVAPAQRRMPSSWRRAAIDVATALPITKIAARSARPESPERSVWNERR
jgi:hypothetical protein